MDSAAADPRPSSFFATLRDAIRGTAGDFTAMPIGRAVMLLAIPMVLEMSMESLFAVVDIFFVARLGATAIAIVGVTETAASLVYAVAMGLSAGATATVARRVGEKDPEAASRAAFHVIVTAVAVSAVVGVIGASLAPQILRAIGASDALAREGPLYTTIMLGGNVTVLLLFVQNAIFRAAGDAATAMRSLWLANGLNIVLAPLFIFGVGPFHGLGVVGAAVATNLGRGVGVGYQLVRLVSGTERIAIARRHFALRLRLLGDIARLASLAALQTLVETASWLGLVGIFASFGSNALAGYTIGMRVLIFALLPSWGMANAAATLVGQNLGAGSPDRAARSVRIAAAYNVVFLGLASLVFVTLARPIVGLFTTDPAVVPIAIDCLRIVALGFLFFAVGMVVVQAFNGAGDTTTPMVVNVFSFWLVKLPFAYALAYGAGLGPRGGFIAIASAYSLQSIIGALLFRRGRWKTRKV